MDTKHADDLQTITDELLMVSEVRVEHVHHYGSLTIICYVMLDTGQRRIGIYDVDLESVADIVADEE